jgi:hypothetical protein
MTNQPHMVAIGGVGGSGTRLGAALLQVLGYYIGDDLNESLDNLWFTLLFKRRSILLENLDLDFAISSRCSFRGCLLNPISRTSSARSC